MAMRATLQRFADQLMVSQEQVGRLPTPPSNDYVRGERGSAQRRPERLSSVSSFASICEPAIPSARIPACIRKLVTDLPRFGTIVAVDSNAIAEHLERLLKIADRVNVWRARSR
jgi:hypothetical protein